MSFIMNACIERMVICKLAGIDRVSGFRAITAFPMEVIEHALAHQLRDKAEAAGIGRESTARSCRHGWITVLRYKSKRSKIGQMHEWATAREKVYQPKIHAAFRGDYRSFYVRVGCHSSERQLTNAGSTPFSRTELSRP